jgi:hypothetical protein
MNDEGYSGQKITLGDDDKTLTGRTEVNTFAKAYAQESNITIPRQLEREIRRGKKRERRETESNDVMKNDITMAELNKSIKQLKKKSPGLDHVTNEIPQHVPWQHH